MTRKIHATADVDPTAQIGNNCQIWHLSQVRERAYLDDGCIVGRGVYIGPGVTCGPNCKIQNYALVYEPAQLRAGVFIGPGATLTNDQRPRAINPDGDRKTVSDWESVGVVVEEGASIGAGAICVAPLKIGRWAMIGAGSVVIQDVLDHALMVGNPARLVGWVCRCGMPLKQETETFACMTCDDKYSLCEVGLSLVS